MNQIKNKKLRIKIHLIKSWIVMKKIPMQKIQNLIKIKI